VQFDAAWNKLMRLSCKWMRLGSRSQSHRKLAGTDGGHRFVYE
jgi:hypothetical protein